MRNLQFVYLSVAPVCIPTHCVLLPEPFSISEIRVHLTIGFLALTPYSPTSPIPLKLQITGDGILKLGHLSGQYQFACYGHRICGRLSIVAMETLPLSILFSYDASLKCPQDNGDLCQLSDVIKESSSFSPLPAAIWPFSGPSWSPRGCQWLLELHSFFPLAEERE